MGSQQDPFFRSGLKSIVRGISKKLCTVGSRGISVNIGTLLVTFSLVFASFLNPTPAQASVFSWLFGTVQAQESEATSLPNSQEMDLLEAPISPDGGVQAGKGDISIVEGTSLLPETPAVSDAGSKTADDDQISIYVCRAGDTLSGIAKMFDVTVNTIRWANENLKDCKTGQTIIILPISGIQHIVKKGDTLQSIAKLYKGDLDEITSYNNLSTNTKLVVGDTVFVPDGEATSVSISKKNISSGGKAGSSYPVYDGYYMRPVVGGRKSQGIHGHNGIDIASAYGTPILASAEGDVIIARGSGYNGGYGLYVVIKHSNGTQTLYAHMSRTLVSPGDHVEQGQVIGRMGSTGKSTGNHLHFEIRGARNPF